MKKVNEIQENYIHVLNKILKIIYENHNYGLRAKTLVKQN